MPIPPSPEELAEKARFVFRGTIQKLHAATLPEIRDTSKTAVVKVDEIVQAPKALSHYTGQEITVQLEDVTEVHVGDRAVFFTDPWVFGNAGVAVRVLGHHPPGPATAALRPAGSNAVTNLEDRDVHAHYAASDMVISGTVVSVGLLTEAQRSRGPREHDPDWREAVVQIDKVHKGKPERKTVVVRFPASNDRLWHRAPKLQPGHQGYFLLHKPSAAASALAGAPTQDYYTILHPDDFERADHPGRIRRLLSNLPQGEAH